MVAFGSCAHMGGIPGLANLVHQGGDLRLRLPRQPLASSLATARCRCHETAGDGWRRWRSPSSTSGSTSSTTSSTSTTTCPAARRRPTRSRRCSWRWSTGKRSPPKGSVVGASDRSALRRLPAHQGREEDQAVLPAVADHPGVRARACWSRASSARARPPARAAACAAPTATCPAAAATGPRPASATRAPSSSARSASIIDSKDPEEIDRIIADAARLRRLRLPLRPAGLDAAEEASRMTRKINIDPITRLEGHGKIEIFLDDDGAVEDCFFQIPELRGFERFVVGRPSRSCRASSPASAACARPATTWPAPRPWTAASAARCRRWPTSCARCTTTRTTSTATSRTSTPSRRPTSCCGPDSDPAHAQHPRRGRQGRARDRRRRSSRPGPWRRTSRASSAGASRTSVWCMPGGVSKGLTKEELEQIKPMVDELYDFAQFSLAALPRRGARQPGLRRHHPQRPVHARRAEHGAGRREQRAELLRRQGARRRLQRQGDLQVRAQATTPSTWPSTSSPGPT